MLNPNSTRMELYGDPHTESCVSAITWPLFIRRRPTVQNMPWGACFPAESTLKESFTELQLHLHFLVGRSVIKPQQKLLQHCKWAKVTGVHHITAVLLNASGEQYYGNFFHQQSLCFTFHD